MTQIVVDAVAVFSLFIARSVQFTLVPFRLLVTGLITNLDTRGNSSSLETLETLNKVEFTVILDTCWDTPTEEINLMNVCTCPCSFCSGDDVHLRILIFVEHTSSSCSPSHVITSSEGDNSNPADQDCHVITAFLHQRYQSVLTCCNASTAHNVHQRYQTCLEQHCLAYIPTESSLFWV